MPWESSRQGTTKSLISVKDDDVFTSLVQQNHIQLGRNRHAYRTNPTHYQLESAPRADTIQVLLIQQPATKDDERPLTQKKMASVKQQLPSDQDHISSTKSVPSSCLLYGRSSPVVCRHRSREEHLSHAFSFDDREDDATCTRNQSGSNPHSFR